MPEPFRYTLPKLPFRKVDDVLQRSCTSAKLDHATCDLLQFGHELQKAAQETYPVEVTAVFFAVRDLTYRVPVPDRSAEKLCTEKPLSTATVLTGD